MSAASETLPSAQIPSRYFWRRAFGYAIDLLLALLAFSLILLLLSKLPIGIPPISFFNTTYCEPAARGPVAVQVEALWPLKPGEIRTNQSCSSSRIAQDQRIFVSSVSVRQGASTMTKFVTVLVDANGVEIKEAPSGLEVIYNLAALLGMAALFAFLIAKRRDTVGKWLFGLQVTSLNPGPVGFSQALKREVLKALPLLIVAVVQIAAFYLSKQAAMSVEEKIIFVQSADMGSVKNGLLATVVFALGLMAWWVWPLIFWRGQTFYDRISSCRVVRRNLDNPHDATSAANRVS